MLITNRLVSAIVSIFAIFLIAQKVSTNVSTVSDIFLTDTGLLPLPDNAVELERISTIRSEHFRSPLFLALSPDGLLYVSSWYNNSVVAFDLEGIFRSRLGGEAPGKEFLRSPGHLAASKNGLIIHETDRGRAPYNRYDLRLVSYTGKTIGKIDSGIIDDIAAAPDGRLFSAPRIESPSSRLLLSYRLNGSTSAFGAPLDLGIDLGILNGRSITITDHNGIYIAFRLLPILRRYSMEGILMEEYVIYSPVIDAKDRFNHGALQQSAGVNGGFVGPYIEIFKGIETCGERLFLLSDHPRLEIMELDMSGRTSATYWMDCPEIYTTNDLAVSDIGGELRFYVSRADPPRYEIDIFRKSKKLFPPGLAGELEKLTAEIEVNPKYYLPWHNRGVIKHQLGDYRGAIDDFTKAIELAADHALPFHNRGLSRVKVKEYASAIDDFTNAIEIALSSQALYDRGVARALMADYENAIGDFERAAEIDPAFRARSTEQIRVCRRLMKVGKDSLV